MHSSRARTVLLPFRHVGSVNSASATNTFSHSRMNPSQNSYITEPTINIAACQIQHVLISFRHCANCHYRLHEVGYGRIIAETDMLCLLQ